MPTFTPCGFTPPRLESALTRGNSVTPPHHNGGMTQQFTTDQSDTGQASEPPGRAPGRYKRKGLTLADLFDLFPSDAAADEWFIAQRWPGGARCPRCGSDNVLDGTSHRTMRFRCRPCNRFFSTKSGSLMEGSKIGYREWALAIYLVTTSPKGVSSMKLHRDLGVTQRTAWFMLHRIRDAWTQRQGELFEGPVEVDETFIGGRAKNMRYPRRKRVIKGTGGVGSGKVTVIGIKDRATGRVVARPVASTSRADLVAVIEETVKPEASVFTDENSSYRRLYMNYRHRSVVHSGHVYVKGDVHVNTIESCWSLFKRGYHGTYHHMSPKHLQRYVDEFVGRHNCRPLDTRDQMGLVVEGMVGKRLTYETGRPSPLAPRGRLRRVTLSSG